MLLVPRHPNLEKGLLEVTGVDVAAVEADLKAMMEVC